MRIHRLRDFADNGYTVVGSMWERGSVKRDSSFMVRTSDVEKEVQSRVTAYWPDGSVKWAAHVVDAGRIGDEAEIIPVLNQDTKGVSDAGKDSASDVLSMAKEEISLCNESDDSFDIIAGRTTLKVKKNGNKLFENLSYDGKVRAKSATLSVLIENREDEYTRKVTPFEGKIENAKVMECGISRCVVKFSGTHESEQDKKIPFSVFMEIYKDSPEVRFTHTFFYDGVEEKDFLKGVGISFDVPASGEQYNRHVKFVTDNGCFNEENAMLLCWHPRVDSEIYKAQVEGKKLEFTRDSERNLNAVKASKDMPIWNDYYLFQDSSEHFVIRKRTNKKDVCYIDCLNGNRAKGVAAFGSEQGGIMLGLKDFWQKYPSTIELSDVSRDTAKATIWLLPPQAPAYDFRHYEDTGYSQTYYEGFDVFGASAYGIANTSEYSVRFFDEIIPEDSELYSFYERVQNRAFYYSGAEYFHELKAFGFWSLEKRETKAEVFLEEQLDKAFEFYKNEVEQRKWYGMFDFGDFMHTYDPFRHVWRYDMGGYAWQNTELVPTFWLWFYFLRTGRSDVFKICEAMTRHCSEVDAYHFGKYQGLGSRHNVRHWGCPCKEARIAMAGHHRMYYYLTGDYRLQDYFEEVKDGDVAVGETDPLRFFFDKKDMVYPTHARTGPDWSSFCSNWMTWWEQTEDEKYLEKIKTGIADLKETPLKLMSGTDFEYDPATAHMRYIGDRATGGSHLSICQGSEQTWLEMTELLDDPDWNKMLADYGWFYTLDNAEQNRITQGRIGERQFSYPFMAAGVVAYAAKYYDDEKLGKKVWDILYSALDTEFKQKLFDAKDVPNAGNCDVLKEIPGISTNSTAQWCLNVIVALEFAGKWLPEEFKD
jgi:hypothetical protein